MQARKTPKFIRFIIDDTVIILVILLNAIVLFLHSFDELAQFHKHLEAIDHSLTVYFLIEMLLRIKTAPIESGSWGAGWRYYFSDGWHRMDFILNIISSLSLALIFIDDHLDFEYVMVLRVMRVFKFFRFLEFIPNVRLLAEGAFRAVRASLFVVLGFFVYTFIVGLLSCYLFKSADSEHFSNAFNGFFTIFRAFTGDGWSDIPTHIGLHSSAGMAFFAKMYFMSVVMTGGILGLSIINGIFIDEMNRGKKGEGNEEVGGDRLKALENEVRGLKGVVEELVGELKARK